MRSRNEMEEIYQGVVVGAIHGQLPMSRYQ